MQLPRFYPELTMTMEIVVMRGCINLLVLQLSFHSLINISLSLMEYVTKEALKGVVVAPKQHQCVMLSLVYVIW